MIKLTIISASCILLLSSCGGMQWDRPSAKYRDCLRENPTDKSKCDRYKEEYERKIDSYRGGAGGQPGEGGMYDK